MKDASIKSTILSSIEPIFNKFEHVTVSINDMNMQKIIKLLDHTKPNTWQSKYIFFDNTEKTVNYFAVFGFLSFCYWGERRWQILIDEEILGGSYAMFYILKKIIENKYDLTDPKYIKKISFTDFQKIFEGYENTEIPLIKRRYEILKEIGEVLEKNFEGSFVNLLEQGEFDANKINALLINNFPSLNDIHSYNDYEVKFYRKSQEIIALIQEAFEGKSFGEIKNLEDLTLSSDYKLPQVLNYFGIINYQKNLRDKISDKHIFKMEDNEAIEIRAATIYAGEIIIQELKKRGLNINAQQLSNILWTASQVEKFKEKALPYPRILSEWV